VIYLTVAELVYIAERATGGQVTIRDAGLLEAAAARPQATAFGADAYRDLHAKRSSPAPGAHVLSGSEGFPSGLNRGFPLWAGAGSRRQTGSCS
jgi:hypothetical protein